MCPNPIGGVMFRPAAGDRPTRQINPSPRTSDRKCTPSRPTPRWRRQGARGPASAQPSSSPRACPVHEPPRRIHVCARAGFPANMSLPALRQPGAASCNARVRNVKHRRRRGADGRRCAWLRTSTVSGPGVWARQPCQCANTSVMTVCIVFAVSGAGAYIAAGEACARGVMVVLQTGRAEEGIQTNRDRQRQTKRRTTTARAKLTEAAYG
jgi:hypothetical protein